MGSKKKQTVGYRYFTGAHFVLGIGPLDNLSRVKYGDKVAWSGINTGGTLGIYADDLYGGDDGEGGISGGVNVMMGEPTQGVYGYLAAYQGDHCPAYRGVAGLVFNEFYWGNSPYYKTIAVLAQRIYKTEDGAEQWYSNKACIPADIADASGAEIVTNELVLNALLADQIGVNGVTYSTGESDLFIINPTSGLTYEAFSYFPSDSTPEAAGTPWSCQISVKTEDGAITHYLTDMYATAAAANAAALAAGPITLSGHASYTVFIWDTHSSNNRGGLSLRISVAKASGDMNPVHIIREVLTRVKRVPSGQIDNTNFAEVANVLYDEGFGLSYLWAGETSADEFIQRVLDTIDARLYIHPRTSLYTIKLIRNDYNVDDLITLGTGQIKHVEDYRRPAPEELPNSVAVTYWSSEESSNVTVQSDDIAAILNAGRINSSNRDYSDGVTQSGLASRIAQRDRISSGTPLLSAKLTCTSVAADLLPGDPFVFDWPALHAAPVVMRVAAMKRGGLLNHRVIIEVVEDVFSLDAASIEPPVAEWVDPRNAPLEQATAFAAEATYYEHLQRYGVTRTNEFLTATPDAGMLLATAASGDNAINALVFSDGVQWANLADLSPVGTLTVAAWYLDATLYITWSSVPAVGTVIQIDGELLRYDGQDTEGRSLVGRGCLDTVPAEHAVDAIAWAWDAFAGAEEIERASGEVVDVSAQLRNNSRVGVVSDAVTITLDSRAIRPYPPANVTINSDYYSPFIYGELTLDWVDRNRITQADGTILDFLDGAVTAEVGATYSVEIREAGVIIESATELSGPSYTLTTVGDKVIEISLYTMRDGYRSTQSFVHALTLYVDNSLLLEDGDGLIAESGEMLTME